MTLRKVLKPEIDKGEEHFHLFIYRLIGGTLLPAGVHLSRDMEWPQEDESPSPIGHHTINSTYGEPKWGRVLKEAQNLE